jgi:hypothetical protein
MQRDSKGKFTSKKFELDQIEDVSLQNESVFERPLNLKLVFFIVIAAYLIFLLKPADFAKKQLDSYCDCPNLKTTMDSTSSPPTNHSEKMIKDK